MIQAKRERAQSLHWTLLVHITFAHIWIQDFNLPFLKHTNSGESIHIMLFIIPGENNLFSSYEKT